jgi:hypothetical protein
VLPKVRLNLGLLEKKLTILQSIIRIEGNPTGHIHYQYDG